MFGIGKRKDVYDALFGGPREPIAPRAEVAPEVPVVDVSSLLAAPVRWSVDDGSKYPGGYGPTELWLTDYWTLRQRSAHLFATNMYARGIVRRLVTNEINTGLHLEATPNEAILGVEEDSLADWSENVENRFSIWESEPTLCDYSEQRTFGQLQALARLESLVCGDVLVVLRQDQRTGLPRVQLINGAAVQTPFPHPQGARIVEGVELDSMNRHVAYWIRQEDNKSKRLPAWGEKSGRRLAWLVYGSDRRVDEVRGTPLLSIVLQSLKEIDRYRDSVQRKAVINAMLAMFIKKTQDKPATRSITGGGAVRRGIEAIGMQPDGTPRMFRTAQLIPGLVIDELQTGEEPQAFASNGTDERFGGFEEAMIAGMAWHFEIPPEVLTLSFNSNYSASQAAINEFKMYLNKTRANFGQEFCQPIFCDWMLSESLSRKIDAPRFIEAWRDPLQYDVLGAWTCADWAGQIKPAVDQSKLVDGYAALVQQGFITRDRATRELTGLKYSQNTKKLKRENEALHDANKELADLKSRERGKGDASDAEEDPPAQQRQQQAPPPLKLTPKKAS
jgi:lambda family phage portal protein